MTQAKRHTSAIPPLMLKTEKNPGGLPIEVFDEMRQALSRDRSQFWEDVSKPFYGANREGAAVSRGVLDAFRLMSMQAGFKGPTTASKRSRRRT